MMLSWGMLLAAAVWATAAWWNRGRGAAVALALAFAGLVMAVPEGMARPKPSGWEARVWIKEAEVLWVRIAEGKGVYAMLLLPGLDEPRYYVLPWDRKLAGELAKLRDRMEKGERVMLPYPFEKSLEHRKPLVPHVLPPPALPKKAGERPPERPQEWQM